MVRHEHPVRIRRGCSSGRRGTAWGPGRRSGAAGANGSAGLGRSAGGSSIRPRSEGGRRGEPARDASVATRGGGGVGASLGFVS